MFHCLSVCFGKLNVFFNNVLFYLVLKILAYVGLSISFSLFFYFILFFCWGVLVKYIFIFKKCLGIEFAMVTVHSPWYENFMLLISFLFWGVGGGGGVPFIWGLHIFPLAVC